MSKINLFLSYSVLIIIIICINKIHGKIPDYQLCADEKCSKIIAEGKTIQAFNHPGDSASLRFTSNEPVKIYSQPYDLKNDKIYVEINGRVGYASKKNILEIKIHIKKERLIYKVPSTVNKNGKVEMVQPGDLNTLSQQQKQEEQRLRLQREEKRRQEQQQQQQQTQPKEESVKLPSESVNQQQQQPQIPVENQQEQPLAPLTASNDQPPPSDPQETKPPTNTVDDVAVDEPLAIKKTAYQTTETIVESTNDADSSLPIENTNEETTLKTKPITITTNTDDQLSEISTEPSSTASSATITNENLTNEEIVKTANNLQQSTEKPASITVDNLANFVDQPADIEPPNETIEHNNESNTAENITNEKTNINSTDESSQNNQPPNVDQIIDNKNDSNENVDIKEILQSQNDSIDVTNNDMPTIQDEQLMENASFSSTLPPQETGNLNDSTPPLIVNTQPEEQQFNTNNSEQSIVTEQNQIINEQNIQTTTQTEQPNTMPPLFNHNTGGSILPPTPIVTHGGDGNAARENVYQPTSSYPSTPPDQHYPNQPQKIQENFEPTENTSSSPSSPSVSLQNDTEIPETNFAEPPIKLQTNTPPQLPPSEPIYSDNIPTLPITEPYIPKNDNTAGKLPPPQAPEPLPLPILSPWQSNPLPPAIPPPSLQSLTDTDKIDNNLVIGEGTVLPMLDNNENSFSSKVEEPINENPVLEQPLSVVNNVDNEEINNEGGFMSNILTTIYGWFGDSAATTTNDVSQDVSLDSSSEMGQQGHQTEGNIIGDDDYCVKLTPDSVCPIRKSPPPPSSSSSSGFGTTASEMMDQSAAYLSDGLNRAANANYNEILLIFLEQIIGMSGVIIYTLITGFIVLILLLGHHCLANNRKEHTLISKLNIIERRLMVSEKECEDLTNRLVETKHKLTSIEDNSFGSNEMVIALKKELDDKIQECLELKDQVNGLEKELDTATDAGLELNKMVETLLKNQTGSESIISSVEELQRQLNEQEATSNEITALLAEKSRENSELHVRLQEYSMKYDTELNEIMQQNETVMLDNQQLHEKYDQLQKEYSERIDKDLKRKTDEFDKCRRELDETKRKYEQCRLDNQTNAARVKVLENLVKELGEKQQEGGDKNNDSVEQLLNETNMKAELLALTEEKKHLTDKLEDELDARRLLEDHVKIVGEEVSVLRQNYNLAEKDKLEAQTRLEVLSTYFKEKETQLQKELSLKEAITMKQQGETTSTVERIRSMQTEIQELRSTNDSLKAEIEAQLAAHKAQIAAAENRAHSSWLTARQAERRIEESRSEASALRRKLTSLGGSAAANGIPETGLNSSLIDGGGINDILNQAPSPIHMDPTGGLMTGPPLPLPLHHPSFLPPPPFIGGGGGVPPLLPPPHSAFMPPPPLPFIPPPPGAPSNVLGRLMSPPPPLGVGVVGHNNRYSPIDRYGGGGGGGGGGGRGGGGGGNDRYTPNRYDDDRGGYDYDDYDDDDDEYSRNRDLMSTYETETDFSPPPSPEPPMSRGYNNNNSNQSRGGDNYHHRSSQSSYNNNTNSNNNSNTSNNRRYSPPPPPPTTTVNKTTDNRSKKSSSKGGLRSSGSVDSLGSRKSHGGKV